MFFAVFNNVAKNIFIEFIVNVIYIYIFAYKCIFFAFICVYYNIYTYLYVYNIHFIFNICNLFMYKYIKYLKI